MEAIYPLELRYLTDVREAIFPNRELTDMSWDAVKEIPVCSLKMPKSEDGT